MISDPVAARYAEALFDAAKRENRVEDAAAQFDELGRALQQHDNLRRFLVNPDVEVPDKVRVLGVALTAPWVEDVRAFVHVVLSMGRAEFLGGMVEAFRHLVDADRKVARVTVRSAHPFTDSLRVRLVSVLEKAERRTVVLVEETAPELIGGLQVMVDHRMLDGSLTSRLAELRQRLKRVKVTS